MLLRQFKKKVRARLQLIILQQRVFLLLPPAQILLCQGHLLLHQLCQSLLNLRHLPERVRLALNSRHAFFNLPSGVNNLIERRDEHFPQQTIHAHK